ncbi:hypothetical protein GRJ2_000241600 [Grus japonensis]|uniref:Uncharacterized protein n=1 Tax=Grus japonensis TaxID=30415 RepID=A0ABC9VY48_GRUJA
MYLAFYKRKHSPRISHLLVHGATSFERRKRKKKLRRGTEKTSCIWKPVGILAVTQFFLPSFLCPAMRLQ